MKRVSILTHEFVEYIPDKLQDGTIYISVKYATAVHKCCCGCGNEVVTPLAPTEWKLIFDGQSISLYPSIGNWSFACQSHYWIKKNKVRWAPRWSQEKINAGRVHDSLAKNRYFVQIYTPTTHDANASTRGQKEDGSTESFWCKVKRQLL